jgi:hypothetical protein
MVRSPSTFPLSGSTQRVKEPELMAPERLLSACCLKTAALMTSSLNVFIIGRFSPSMAKKDLNIGYSETTMTLHDLIYNVDLAVITMPLDSEVTSATMRQQNNRVDLDFYLHRIFRKKSFRFVNPSTTRLHLLT